MIWYNTSLIINAVERYVLTFHSVQGNLNISSLELAYYAL